MSPKLPQVTAAEVVRVIERDGWVFARQSGSHMSFRKEGNPRVVVVPRHTRPLKRGTVSGILRDTGLTVERFLELLRS